MGAEFGGTFSGGSKHLRLLLPPDLITFIDEPQLAHVRLVGEKFNQPFIGRHEGTAGVHDDDDAGEARPVGEVPAHKRRPRGAHFGRGFRVAVTGKVDEVGDVFAILRFARAACVPAFWRQTQAAPAA